jgi:hypothetical protein
MNDRKEAQEPSPGPDAERLEIEGDCEERLAEALRKTRPKESWPKPEKQPKPMERHLEEADDREPES